MIADLNYTRSFIAAWSTKGARGKRFIARAAEAQYENLKYLLWDRRHHKRLPTWCNLREYVAAVRLLRAAAKGGAI